MNNKKVAILFFGLTRSLKETHVSIKKNLFDPLNENSIDYDIFIHTYKIFGSYHNKWSKEATDNYINEDVDKLLNPKYFIFDNQETIVNNIDFNEYYKKLGNWSGSMTKDLTKYLIRNMCLALYSKKQITSIFDKNINDYDYAIIIRPDLELVTKIDVNWFNQLNDNNIIVPSMERFGGCNDRICIGKPNIISYCGNLFDGLKVYSEKKEIVSEIYFMDKLNEKSITIIRKNIKYKTKRLNNNK